jgi:hypothetical protein
MEQRTRNYGWWQRGDNGADDNDKKTAINKYVGAEADNNDGWQEAGRSGGDRGAAVVRRQKRNSFGIRSWRIEVEDGWGCSFFLFMARLNPISNPISRNTAQILT